MADFAKYLSNLSKGLKILSNDIDGMVKHKEEQMKNQDKNKDKDRDDKSGKNDDRDSKTKTGISKKPNFNSFMSTNRLMTSAEVEESKQGKSDEDVEKIKKALDKIFGG